MIAIRREDPLEQDGLTTVDIVAGRDCSRSSGECPRNGSHRAKCAAVASSAGRDAMSPGRPGPCDDVAG